jgi:hypothetical protein
MRFPLLLLELIVEIPGSRKQPVAAKDVDYLLCVFMRLLKGLARAAAGPADQ